MSARTGVAAPTASNGTREALLFLCICLLSGCAASTQTGSSAAPHPDRYAAASHQLTTADWVGRYAGKCDAYSAASGEWWTSVPIALMVRRARTDGLIFTGTVGDTLSFGLEAGTAGGAPAVLNGTYRAEADEPRYTYSLSLRGIRISGVIKRYVPGKSNGPSVAPDEWVIQVARIAAEP